MYEAFMVDYGLMPDEADERFSIRQMGELIKARTKRIEAEAHTNAHTLIKGLFGEGGAGKQDIVSTHNDSPDSMKVFGIKVTNDGGDDDG